MANFWHTLPAGFIGLSPMDGVTDCAFRTISKKHGNPDVMYTEFTSVEGIAHGATRLLRDFLYEETQRPIIAQVFGHTPRDFYTSTIVVCELGFDAIDINMGCPMKNIASQGSGAALIRTPKLAQEIIRSVQQAVIDWSNGKTLDDIDLTDEMKSVLSQRKVSRQDKEPLPVSVKTRIGYDNPVIEEWIPNLLEMKPVAIAIHGRTLKQAYSGQAQWEFIGKAVELAKDSDTLMIGNGDVKSVAHARERIRDYGVDGVLIGREAFGNPWIFKEKIPTASERFSVAIEHVELYEKLHSHEAFYQFIPMRKHLGWYIKDMPRAAEIRQQLFSSHTAEEVLHILKNNL